MATDPEGKAITWTVLGGADADALAEAAAFDAEDLKVNQRWPAPGPCWPSRARPTTKDPEGGALASPDDTAKGNIYTVKLRAAVNDAYGN